MEKENIFELVKNYCEEWKNQPFVPGETKVTVGFPCFGHEEVNAALNSLLELNISQGKNVRTFERNYSAYVGTKHGVAVNSGSSANLLAITALLRTGKVKPGSEVIVPSATFATVVSPIIQTGLVPVFVDVEDETYNISPDEIEKAITANTGLIMPVHSLGCPADMKAIMRIAEKHNLPVLEDCCEAHGASINGQVVGSFGLLGTYSFFVAHNMTTGEGGMIMTNDDELADTLRSIREFGRLKEYDPSKPRFYYTDERLTDYDERYVFEAIGYNVRMTDVHASLGIEQLKKLDATNKTRVEAAAYYESRLKKFERHLELPKTPKGAFHSFYGYTIFVKKDAPFTRTELVRFLEDHHIETRAFMGGHLAIQPGFRNENIKISGDLPVTQHVLKNAFFIGCHPRVDQRQREYVVQVFEKFFRGKHVLEE